MEKPQSLSGLEALLKELEKDRSDFYRKEVSNKVHAYRSKLEEETKTFMDAYRQKIDAVKDAINVKKLELKKKNQKIDPKIETYVNRQFSSGVDFGYGGLSVRYVDPEKRFIIITNNGGTAGQGTAMGTGAYYYASCSHFVAFPQYGIWMEARLPHNKDKEGYLRRGNNTMFEITGGRFTNEIRDKLIKQAVEYCEQYNVQPFEI